MIRTVSRTIDFDDSEGMTDATFQKLIQLSKRHPDGTNSTLFSAAVVQQLLTEIEDLKSEIRILLDQTGGETQPLRRRRKIPKATAIPTNRLQLGSGTELAVMKSVAAVVPSRFTLTTKANPLAESFVNTGVVPAASENMLNANVLPEVDVPSGEFRALPYRLTSKDSFESNVNPSK